VARQNYCGNCGNKQGPFDRLWIGFRKTGQWNVTCKDPKDQTAEKRAAAAKACNDRREKQNAAAYKGDIEKG
jgi:hypothetical protein